MTEIVHIGGSMPTAAEYDTAIRISTDLANSGLFKDSRQATQAFAKIMLGRDLGLSPAQSMISIHVVDGKPELSANLQAQLVKTYRGPDGERYDYRVTESTDDACAVTFLRREPGGDWDTLGTERFTMDDAKRAGLATKNVWKSYPRNMLWARAISNGINFHCPEVARGLRVYHEGEIGGTDPDPQPTPTASPDAVPPIVEDVPEAVVVEDRGEDGLTAVAEQAVKDGALTTQVISALLIGHGATDTTSVGAALRSMPDDGVQAFADALAEALEQAGHTDEQAPVAA